MRLAARALRDGFSLPARPPWGYGVLCGLAVAGPLLGGVLAGRPDTGAFLALGAYLTAFGDTYGQPYASRAGNMACKILFIAAASWLGLFLAPHQWWAVLALGVVAGVGGRWRVVGMPPVFALVIGFYLGVPAALGPPELMIIGGVLYAVLALALWPVRRLDPLKAALDDAVQAIAGMLDGLALPDKEWAGLRERGSKALATAGTASTAFGSVDETGRSAEAYVQALVRIFHETVALRALRAAAGEERGEIDDVVGTLSAALRESGGVREALAVTAEFAERLAARRPDGDPAALRRGAVLGQVRRCLDRIAVAVRAVGLLAAEGVRPPGRLPHRLAWKAPPAGSGLEHAGRLGIAAAVAMALMLGVHEQYGKWFVFTVLLALRPSYGDTVERVVLRVAGTVLGAAGAALILAAVPGPYTIVGTVLVFATAGFALREVSYGYWSVFATPLAMMLADFSMPLDWEAAGFRLALTAGGGLLALVAARMLWPRGQAGRLRGLTGELLREHARLVHTLAEFDLDRVAERTEAAGLAADRLSEALDKLDKEPGGSAPAELRESVTLARKLRDDAMLLGAVLRGAAPCSDANAAVLRDAEPGPDASAAVPDATVGVPDATAGVPDATAGVLDAVADRLAAVGQAVRGCERAPEADAFESELAQVAGEVSSLLEEAGAGGVTAVRRRLRQAVTAHPALRSLCTDALDLAAQVTRCFTP